MTPSQIAARLETRAPDLKGGGTRPAVPGAFRGDHDLNPDMGVKDDLMTAAVLVPLVERPGGLTVMLTERTQHLAHHPGQISFPGGGTEPEDPSPEATALRELNEEVGLHAHEVHVIGRLDRYVTRTGFDVIPVVGVITPPFELDPDPHEVADVFEVPLAFLLDPANHERHSRTFEGRDRHFYAMPYEDRFIWGATAGMIKNLYDILLDSHTDEPSAP